MRFPAGEDPVQEGTDAAEANQFTMRRKCERMEYVGNETGKWRPFWQRGHTTMGEYYERSSSSTRLANIRGFKLPLRKETPRKNKMYHSSMELSNEGARSKRVKMSKTASLNALHLHMPSIDNKRRDRDVSFSLSRHNSSLNLPQIEPDIAINTGVGSRDASALDNRSGYLGTTSSAHARISFSRDTIKPAEDTDTDDEDVYLSDDDPHVSRRNLDKAGEYIVEHDWILKETLAKDAKQARRKHNKVRIVLPDDDPLDTIQTRLDEITMMVKPKAEYGNFINTIDPEQRAKIMKYTEIDHNDIRNKKRKNWTVLQRFRAAVDVILLLYRACAPRKKRLQEDTPDTAPDGVKQLKQRSPQEKDVYRKPSLGFELQLALTSQSIYRTKEDLKRITWILRATKAFKHLFPEQLEEQLAKVVSYERYEARRIVAQQGRNPERFYYVLTGKLLKVREYKLLSGVVTREEGAIEKGNTSDPKEMSNNWQREHHLVTKGHVEVLILEKSDFLSLLHTCNGPPIGFLQNLELFQEFPCEEFNTNPDAIDFKYYGQEQIIVKDSNRTPWLHVVKTGNVKVVRQQSVVDVHNDDKFSAQSKEELGCVRNFSHANAMLGVLAKQRKMKTMVGSISFPEILERGGGFERSKTEPNLIPDRLRHRVTDTRFDNPITRTHRIATRPVKPVEDEKEELQQLHQQSQQLQQQQQQQQPQQPQQRLQVTVTEEPTKRQQKKKQKNSKPITFQNGTSSNSSKKLTLPVSADESSPPQKLSTTPTLLVTSPTLTPNSPTKTEKAFLPPISSEKKSEQEFVPHGTYLTREKTMLEPAEKKPKKEVLQRKTYLQLDMLKPGDIFGLDGVAELFKAKYPSVGKFGGFEHLEPQALASEAPGVCLISDGAEIIKISKRFFLNHAKNNTMLKVETMQREYMTPDEAKTVMYDKETWKQYKSVLLQRTVETLHRTSTETVS